MGLIKNFCDYAGTKHQIDPTGHTHSTSESWLSTIVNNLTTLINGKAASVHTHAAITDGTASVSAVNDRGSHIIRINATGVDGTAVDADHAVEDSDNLITSGAVYSGLAGKANSIHTHAATQVTVQGDYPNLQDKLNCCQVFSIQGSTNDINVDDIFKNHISEQTAVGEDAICVEVCVSSESKKISQILTGSDRGFFFLNGCGDIIPKGDGAFVKIYGFSATNYIVALSSDVYDTTPTEGSKNILTSGAVATALAGKANSSSLSSKADKVSNATNGNFAALNSNGNLTDSGKNASDFASASHTHNKTNLILDLENGLVTLDDKGIGDNQSVQIVLSYGNDEERTLSEIIRRNLSSLEGEGVEFNGNDGSYSLGSGNFVIVNVWKGNFYPNGESDNHYYVSILFKGENI